MACEELPESIRSNISKYAPIVEEFRSSGMKVAQVMGVPMDKQNSVRQAIKLYIEKKSLRDTHVCIRNKKVYLSRID